MVGWYRGRETGKREENARAKIIILWNTSLWLLESIQII
jgi:hypothetical protein